MSYEVHMHLIFMLRYKLKPTFLSAPNTTELKPLLKNLKYVFLDDEERLFVIISTSLTIEQAQRLLQVLIKDKKVIGY